MVPWRKTFFTSSLGGGGHRGDGLGDGHGATRQGAGASSHRGEDADTLGQRKRGNPREVSDS